MFKWSTTILFSDILLLTVTNMVYTNCAPINIIVAVAKAAASANNNRIATTLPNLLIFFAIRISYVANLTGWRLLPFNCGRKWKIERPLVRHYIVIRS